MISEGSFCGKVAVELLFIFAIPGVVIQFLLLTDRRFSYCG